MHWPTETNNRQRGATRGQTAPTYDEALENILNYFRSFTDELYLNFLLENRGDSLDIIKYGSVGAELGGGKFFTQ